MVKTIFVKDLKIGNTIILDNKRFLVTTIEFSNIGKHGKTKCRIEAKDPKTKQEKVIIKLTEDTIDVE